MLILNNSPQQVSVTICDKEYVYADINRGVLEDIGKGC